MRRSPVAGQASEGAKRAAYEQLTAPGEIGPGIGAVQRALAAAHDPALGLDRSVRLGDVVDELRAFDAAGVIKRPGAWADHIECSFTGRASSSPEDLACTEVRGPSLGVGERFRVVEAVLTPETERGELWAWKCPECGDVHQRNLDATDVFCRRHEDEQREYRPQMVRVPVVEQGKRIADDEREKREAWSATVTERVRKIARGLGYAIGEHGTRHRDLDLIAVPWIDDVADPDALTAAVAAEFGEVKEYRVERPHGRLGYTVVFATDEPRPMFPCYIDLSVLPGFRSGEGGGEG